MGDGMMVEAECPDVVKDKHSRFWWGLVLLLGAVCVGRIVSLDILGALLSGIMAFIVYYMLKDNCAKMSQYCLMVFGFMCLMNSILEFIALLGLLGGRSSQTTAATAADPGSSKTVYTVTVEKHPFFDGSQGWVYNTQSAMMIASPVCNLIGALLSYWSYNAFPSSLFQDMGEQRPIGNPGGGGGFGAYGGNEAPRFQGSGNVLGGSSAGRPQQQPRLFEGTGQRLGG